MMCRLQGDGWDCILRDPLTGIDGAPIMGNICAEKWKGAVEMFLWQEFEKIIKER